MVSPYNMYSPCNITHIKIHAHKHTHIFIDTHKHMAQMDTLQYRICVCTVVGTSSCSLCLFLDELDSVAKSRGRNVGDYGNRS